ncbi:ClbS/DfsB family four-helix bundle protein [Kosakonia oryzendophytica]|uniref:ClbS/DfsB family four-helix bundle protein n=1 Tax=Kosakonia oryzendophytica TaxID=1005665 RepID=UPI000776BD50|nr:ClbS/DfsB family four-helix bundle protein [Kosakonia oryzendophytica]WBT59345.1 ClbS/DfsB family four-helix bundle protein [Kosakonia oryzendophytica]
MAVPQSKDELLASMEKSWLTLQKKLDRIPVDIAFTPLLEGHASGTTMSAANLVSYLLGWGEQVIYWHQQEASEKQIDFPAAGFKWNELGKLAQKYYSDYADITDWLTLRAKLEQCYHALVMLVESYSDEALYQQQWYGKWTRGRMIQFNTVSPWNNATSRLNALLKTSTAAK